MFIVLLLALLASPAAHAAKDTSECERVKRKIRAIEARMRQGYTASQGIRYEQKLRELREKRYKLCR
ncbi:MAG: hypothetical protein R3358_07595 [Woeseiaceae bacterium]|nr:hypothetical protein [Woeseiaceae bacterium]